MTGLGEILIVLFIVILVFGAAKLPEIARSFGKGMREFKKASSEFGPKDPGGHSEDR